MTLLDAPNVDEDDDVLPTVTVIDGFVATDDFLFRTNYRHIRSTLTVFDASSPAVVADFVYIPAPSLFVSVFDELDDESAQLGRIGAAICDGSGRLHPSIGGPHRDVPLLLPLSTAVAPEWRGQRLSHALLIETAHALLIADDSYLAIDPSPASAGRTDVAGLRRHWKRIGFRSLTNGIMGCRLADLAPRRWDHDQ